MLTEEDETIAHGGHEKETELHFPIPVEGIAQNPADETAEHEACRPARMKDVEVMRAILRKERGDQRIGDGLEGPIRKREDKGAPFQVVVSALLRLAFNRQEGDDRREHMEEEGGDD